MDAFRAEPHRGKSGTLRGVPQLPYTPGMFGSANPRGPQQYRGLVAERAPRRRSIDKIGGRCCQENKRYGACAPLTSFRTGRERCRRERTTPRPMGIARSRHRCRAALALVDATDNANASFDAIELPA